MPNFFPTWHHPHFIEKLEVINEVLLQHFAKHFVKSSWTHHFLSYFIKLEVSPYLSETKVLTCFQNYTPCLPGKLALSIPFGFWLPNIYLFITSSPSAGINVIIKMSLLALELYQFSSIFTNSWKRCPYCAPPFFVFQTVHPPSHFLYALSLFFPVSGSRHTYDIPSDLNTSFQPNSSSFR